MAVNCRCPAPPRPVELCRQITGYGRADDCTAVIWPRWVARARRRKAHTGNCYVARAMERARRTNRMDDLTGLVSTWVAVRADGTVTGVGHPWRHGSARDGYLGLDLVRYQHLRSEYGGDVAFAFVEVTTLDEEAAITEVQAWVARLGRARAWGDAVATRAVLGRGAAYDNRLRGFTESGVRERLRADDAPAVA